MLITFIPVDNTNIEVVSKLHIKASQTGMVESVEDCYAEALSLSLWRPVAIAMEQEFIGFAMYGLWEEEGENGRVWLDRFFIDEHYQGMGLSNKVLPLLLQHIINKYRCKEIYLSVYETNLPAIHLYKKFGFEFNGELDINNENVMVKTIL